MFWKRQNHGHRKQIWGPRGVGEGGGDGGSLGDLQGAKTPLCDTTVLGTRHRAPTETHRTVQQEPQCELWNLVKNLPALVH